MKRASHHTTLPALLTFAGLALTCFTSTTTTAHAEEAKDDPLAPWRSGVKIRSVLPETAERHSIHSYFNTCPESPDGTQVLFYSSTALNGHTGEVHIVNRATGEEKTLVTNLETEDAHRAACQQWLSNGKRISFHGLRDGTWFVGAVDLDTGKERVLAKNRLSSWGQPNGDLVPIYGQHWDPGEHTNLELCNSATGEIKTVLTAQAVRDKYTPWVDKAFQGKPFIIFFPVLSPKADRVFFKLAAPGITRDPRGGAASQRLGLVCYSIAENRFLYQSDRWGHPSWHPDGKTIVETSFTLFDSGNGKGTRLPELPAVRGDHPSASPDGKLIVTDSTMDKFGGDANSWGIVLADARGGKHILLHSFKNDGGARSWRRSHPHPVFSADGKRIYFNVSNGTWTRLYVAEVGDGAAAGK
ncbi:WD40 repeat protein [Roseimicrobium gellanilyticum]|uniref:WD40 repeat protein n=1 Tax=Roseimicrobium gellanilyticum TaxID=748857 RepID=A0A366HN97_9BACT|nr:PD40 domain-containing protein [Roseimicrobium gellanilyticum]RBP44493.1 WD40 repeat protein [Roseimicrobium gellanilyticum]